MSNIAILGNQWGDEGKGSITHHFSKDYDWVIRFGGGANAGHTIYRDGVKYIHNLLPSVDWRVYHVKAYLGSGMVIDLEKLLDEVSTLEKHYPGAAKRVYVDKEAFIVEPRHKEEDKATNTHIGSTNRGIGPAYKDKISRKGIRVNDALSNPEFASLLYSLSCLGVNFVHLLEMQIDARYMKNKNLLFEGAQGIMLDINHGTYPYVSCSDATVSGIYANGFAHIKLSHVYGVAKCYLTKVGEGPFPTEILGEVAEELRKRGNEYGATTGRPRRVGWIDLPALKYACQKGGITQLIITKFDILDGMKKVPVCSSYDKAPVCPTDFFNTKVNYDLVNGWESAKNDDQIDSFIAFVEEKTQLEVDFVSAGIGENDIRKWY